MYREYKSFWHYDFWAGRLGGQELQSFDCSMVSERQPLTNHCLVFQPNSPKTLCHQLVPILLVCRIFIIICISFYFTEMCTPSDWVYFNNSCFKVFKEELNWFDAHRSCTSNKSTLISIHSTEENNLLRKTDKLRFRLPGSDCST